jgi:hypothetical protein
MLEPMALIVAIKRELILLEPRLDSWHTTIVKLR